jgi:hypothetical protein
MEPEGLLHFRGNQSLADITLLKASAPDAAPIKGHKVVLAAASGIFFDLFTKENQELVTDFTIPAYILTNLPVIEDPYTKAFSYMYSNQEFRKVKEELNSKNVFQLYSVAFTLQIKKLIQDLEDYIVQELVNNENWVSLYLDGIRFESKKVTDACEKFIIQEFSIKYLPYDHTEETKGPNGELHEPESINSHELLNKLPLEYFQRLMKSDALNVENEVKVLDWVEKYVKFRLEVNVDKTEEEIKAENDVILAAGGEVPLTEEQVETASNDEKFAALDDAGKIAWKYSIQVNEMHKKALERMKVRGLRTEHKRELFKAIRYAFLTHQQLLKISKDKLFEEAKEYIVEGLTFKIEPEEVRMKDDTLINLRPRESYNYDAEELGVRSPQHHRLDHTGKPQFQNNPQSDHSIRRNKPSPERDHVNRINGNRRGGYQQDRHTLRGGQRKSQVGYPSRTYGGMDDTFAREGFDDRSSSPRAPIKFDLPGGSKSRRIGPQSSSPLQNNAKNSFDYSFDFDENGLFNFLGTSGGRKLWQNPHLIGQVHAFASSIGFGSVNDLVGRKCVNLRTLNEPFSFFGVDLGEGRKIMPTCYTIMNRNSSTHVLMNWHFEGSNDKFNWTILDRRVYMPHQLDGGEAEVNVYIDDEVLESLSQKQGTNTWGVDQSVFNVTDDEGFRFFRIIQISANSSGSDNLALSCFELYGRIVSGRFT